MQLYLLCNSSNLAHWNTSIIGLFSDKEKCLTVAQTYVSESEFVKEMTEKDLKDMVETLKFDLPYTYGTPSWCLYIETFTYDGPTQSSMFVLEKGVSPSGDCEFYLFPTREETLHGLWEQMEPFQPTISKEEFWKLCQDETSYFSPEEYLKKQDTFVDFPDGTSYIFPLTFTIMNIPIEND